MNSRRVCAGLGMARESLLVVRRLAGIGLLVLFVAAAPARAATVLSTWDFSVDGLGDFTLAGSLDRFEPTRGTLQKVCLGMTGEAGVEL